MPIRYTYADHGDACVAAHAMDVIGDRWAVVVIRELLLGPKGFAELTTDLYGITPAVLSTRLRELTDRGLVEHSPADGSRRYQLTPWGREFESVLIALGRWAYTSPQRPASGSLTPDGVVVAMRTMGPKKRSETARFDLVLRDDRSPQRPPSRYRVTWNRHDFSVVLRSPPLTDVVYCDSGHWAMLLFDPDAVDPELDDQLTSTGNGLRAAAAFVRDFRQPDDRA